MEGRDTVSVVVVNYNRKDMLSACLRSVLDQTRAAEQVIVVDNGSEDGSAALVQEEFGGRVQLIELPYNSGFAGGNNAGIRAAETEWVALINNDAVADPIWLAELMGAVEGRAEAGLAACTIVRGDRRDLLENLGVGLARDGMSRGSRHFARAAEVPDHSVLIPSGCAALVRRSAFQEADGFDERFFCYSEDTDLFLKIRILGWNTVLARRACAYHHPGGGTLGVISPQKTYLVERNRLFILFRFYPAGAVMASPVHTFTRYLALAAEVIKTGGRGREGRQAGSVLKNLWSLVKAYAHAFYRLPSELENRRRVREQTRVCPGSMKRWLVVYRLDPRSLRSLGP